MKKKLLGYVVGNHKMELLTKLDKAGEFEVYYLFLKHLDYLDAVKAGFPEHKLFSYPQLRKEYRKNQTRDQLIERISENEKKFGIRAANKLISYNFKRSMLPNFNERNLLETILFEHEMHLQLIDQVNPDAILGELSRSYYLIAYDLCKHFKINFFNPVELRANYYGEPLYSLFDDEGDKLRLKELFDEYQNGSKKPSENAQIFADEYEDRIFNKSKFSSKKLRSFGSGSSLFIKKAKKRIKNLESYFKAFNIDRKYFAERHEFKNQLFSIVKRFVIAPIRTPIVHRLKSRYYKAKLDLNSINYLYFPLHFYPELVSSVWSNKFIHYHDQELHLVQSISKNLPTGYKLLVKEHMPMVNNRKTRFYKKINSYYNTVLIAPGFNSFELIEKSKCVVTISSSTGFEALLKDKPVLTFKGAFYKHIPSINVIDLNGDLHEQIVAAITNYKPSPEFRQNALCAFYDSSCSFKYGGDSVNEFDITYDETSISRIANFLKSFLIG